VIPGAASHVEVTASAEGRIDAWIDFNRDGDWNDAGERIFSSISVRAGTSNLEFLQHLRRRLPLHRKRPGFHDHVLGHLALGSAALRRFYVVVAFPR
jgi:hypothetical protein